MAPNEVHYDEIDCRDLFSERDDRERIMVFVLGGGSNRKQRRLIAGGPQQRNGDCDVFHDWNHGWEEGVFFFSDNSVQQMRTLRALSGLHDLYVVAFVFHSLFSLEQALLCGDYLLSYPLRAESSWPGGVIFTQQLSIAFILSA